MPWPPRPGSAAPRSPISSAASTAPSLTAATNVARALRVSLAELLGDEDRRPVVTIPERRAPGLPRPGNGDRASIALPRLRRPRYRVHPRYPPPFTATDDLRPYHPAIDKYVLVEVGHAARSLSARSRTSCRRAMLSTSGPASHTASRTPAPSAAATWRSLITRRLVEDLFVQGIDNGARRVYVHCTPNADGSNPGSGQHSRRR